MSQAESIGRPAARLTFPLAGQGAGRWPAPVKPGGVLGVFALSSPFPEDRFEAGLAALRGLGYAVKVPPNLQEAQGYLAASDDVRLENFINLWRDPAVDGLIAARGGYGVTRLLPALAELWPEGDKPVIGFSDLTALHLARFQISGVIGYHGPVVTSINDNPHPEALADFLDEPQKERHWHFAPGSVIQRGEAEGVLLGGNLTLVMHLLSGPWFPETERIILLLEDVGEAPYRLDRLFTTLEQNRLWPRVAALVLGGFTKCGDEGQVDGILAGLVKNFKGPIVKDAPFGHGCLNRPWPVGAAGRLEVFQRGARPQ